MAKQGKVIPARRPRRSAEPSVLLRSAESLGRVIGLLQRQLDNVSKRGLSGADGDGTAPSRKATANNGSAKAAARTSSSASKRTTSPPKRTAKKSSSSSRRRKG
jgi:hypothetical protein